MNEYEKYFLIPTEKRNQLGVFIGNIRKTKKLTFARLSEKSGLSESELYKIENAKKGKISPYQLQLLGRALNVDYKILYVFVGFLEEKDLGNPSLVLKDYGWSLEYMNEEGHQNAIQEIVPVPNKMIISLSDEEADKIKEYLAFLRSQNK